MLRTSLLCVALAFACGDDGGDRPVDASPDAISVDAATTNGVACGSETLCAAPNVCCASMTTQSCDLAAGCAEGEIALACDEPEDCSRSGEGCCLGEAGSSCLDAASCSGGLYCKGPDDCDGGECGTLGFCLP